MLMLLFLQFKRAPKEELNRDLDDFLCSPQNVKALFTLKMHFKSRKSGSLSLHTECNFSCSPAARNVILTKVNYIQRQLV